MYTLEKSMTRALTIAFAIVITFAVARPASATNITTFYDTITAVDITTNPDGFTVALTITGVKTGTTTTTTTSFSFLTDAELAGKCERQAVDAMFNPGVLRFGIGPHILNQTSNGGGGCRLIRLF
jgi:hypothetical protein